MLSKNHRAGSSLVEQANTSGFNVHGINSSVRFLLADSPTPAWKIAAVVSRKVAKEAVTRNRIRRQWYEVVRTSVKITNLLEKAAKDRSSVIVCVFIIKKINVQKDLVETEVLDLIQRALDRVDKTRKIYKNQ